MECGLSVKVLNVVLCVEVCSVVFVCVEYWAVLVGRKAVWCVSGEN